MAGKHVAAAFVALGFALALGGDTQSLAAVIGASDSGLPGTTTFVAYQNLGGSPAYRVAYPPPAPAQPVAYDTSSGTWQWHLENFWSGYGMNPGTRLYVEAQVVNAGSTDWSDWHMSIPIAGWGWSPYTGDYGGSVWGPGGLRADFPASDFVVDGQYLTVDFTKRLDALNPGDRWMFTACVRYSGSTKFWGEAYVNHYPTPEPATFGLLMVGGLALLRRRTR